MARNSGGASGEDDQRPPVTDAGGQPATDDGDVPEDRDSGTDVDEESAYDADELRSEWHVWLVAILLVVGLVGLLAPTGSVPEILVGLAPILIVVAVLAGVGQWLFRRYR